MNAICLKFSWFVILLCIIVSVTTGQTPATSVIKGAVFDQTLEAVIPGVKIIISGNGILESKHTNANGEYKFSVPSGSYYISTETNWWFPVKRSVAKVAEDSEITVNLYPTSREIIQSLEATSKGVVDRYKSNAKKPRYELLSSKESTEGTLLIEYKRKSSRNKIYVYSNAILTNNALTIIAEEIRYEKKTGRITAKNAFIDNNGDRSQSDNFIIP